MLRSINISDELDPKWKQYKTPGCGEVEIDDHYEICH